MDIDKELVMESVKPGAPGKPEMRLGTKEETNEGDANESSLEVLSSNVPLLTLDFLDTTQAKEKVFLPMVSHTFHMPTEESDAPQQGDDLSESSANTSQPKQNDLPKSSAKPIQPKLGTIPKSSAKPIQPKLGTIPKSSAKPIQPKLDSIPKSSAKPIQPKQGDTSKSSVKTIQPKLGNIPKSSVKPSQPKSPEETIQAKEGDIPKSQEETIQAKESDITKSPEETIQAKESDITKSPKEAIQPKEGDIPKLPEEAIQPKEGDIPESPEEAIQPKEGDILIKPEEETTESLEGDMVKMILSKEDFEAALKEAGQKLVAVDFSATWCGPCRTIRPFFHALSEKHEDVVFLEVDADGCEEVVRDCAVMCVPTFQFYKKEEKVDEFCGALKEKLEAVIAELK
ncbi:thioredoxin domain-containing protein 2 [Callithrix jacchus]|uniref:Thioredoxin domain-containing protein 2 n=1 Tax=Callithrix jacchus TaxID=9483 RepID=A0A8I3X2S3_CALJA|nr:thioredoxin domain-containing protein 2 [Callithrix jacchus]